MPRQRFIWPAFWDDPDLGELDADARLLYIGCFSLADDEGRIIGDPVHLKSTIFKYRPDVSIEHVRELRRSLEGACRCFRVYTVRKIEYIAFTNWGDFQKPKYPTPSRLPAPPKTRRSARKPAPLPQTDSGSVSGRTSRNSSGKASPSGSGSDSATGLEGLGSTTKAVTSKEDDARARNENGYVPDEQLDPKARELQAQVAAANDDIPF